MTLTNLVNRPERLACVMSFSLLTDDALCEVARRDMPLLLALQATCKDARRVLSIRLKVQVSVLLQVSLGHRGPCLTLALSMNRA